ncbi:MAG: hypothetical protein Q8J78_17400 [Moraxellaceae bacterium]|nr:hypothetical protein [Moraxellaceae bacterium]
MRAEAMKKVMIVLLATLLGSVAQADPAKMNAMRDAFARMDREDFLDGIEKANSCTLRRDFSCAEKQLADIKELADSSADSRLFTLATSNLQAEKQRVAEEQRIRREEEDRRRRAEAERIAAERAAEEREERRLRREADASRHAAIMGAFADVRQSIDRAGADLESSRARNQAVLNDYHEARAREQRLAAEARAEQSRRDREERIAQQNYDRRRAEASAQLTAALNESRAQSQREEGIRAYQQAQATTAASRSSSALLGGSATAQGTTSAQSPTSAPATPPGNVATGSSAFGSTATADPKPKTSSTAAGSVARGPVAPTVLTFTSNTGWQVSDVSQNLSAQGLTVRLVVTPSTINGKHYYRAEFCDGGAGAWKGGMRLTDSYPDRTHATIRVPAGGCTHWAEHLPAGIRQIYVLVRQEDIGS